LKVESQVDRVVKKAFSMLGFIGQNIEYGSWDVLLKLYKTLVRPHLEYCVQFRSLDYREDIIKLERVRKRVLPEMVRVIRRGWIDWDFFSLEH